MSCRSSNMTTRCEDAEVEISVSPAFMPSESDEDTNWFAYHITIHNHGDVAVRLLSRYWHITDAEDEVREVRGDGVVGEQPVIKPGEHYEYTSFVDFTTPVGFMKGHYTMETADGDRFDAEIAPFILALPSALH